MHNRLQSRIAAAMLKPGNGFREFSVTRLSVTRLSVTRLVDEFGTFETPLDDQRCMRCTRYQSMIAGWQPLQRPRSPWQVSKPLF
jgi:hypothetical protein